jgi:hypothetical protein
MMAPDTAFNANATYAAVGMTSGPSYNPSVLYIEQGPAAAGCPTGATGCKAMTRPPGNGLFLAFVPAGGTPNVWAFDETTGLPVWSASITAGGDGIRGTPVIDAAARQVYVVTGRNPHLVHSLSVDTGVEKMTGGWPVSLSKTTVSYNGLQFNSAGQDQHGANLLLNNTLYIPMGGAWGDCCDGTYNGWIIALNVTNTASIAGWATQSTRSGIWGSAGLASDGVNSVFGQTGDTTVAAGGTVANAQANRLMSDSEELVRVTGMAAFTRAAANVFVPPEADSVPWDKPSHDLDYTASSPSYINLPAGSNPSAIVVSPAKAGQVYILNGTNLSNGTYDANRTPGGQLVKLVVSGTNAETMYTAPTVYSSASGLHVAVNVGGGATGCPGGNPTTQEAVVSMAIPANPAQTRIAWCAPNSQGGNHLNFPPISTTSDGVSADAMVWYVQGSQLVGVNGDTGANVVTTTGAACMGVGSSSFPIAVKNRIVVWAIGHLCSWSVGGI